MNKDPISGKKVVHFSRSKYEFIHKGLPATVFPVDHPDSENVSNKKQAITSNVVAIHEDGFETENTRYKVYRP